MNTILSGLLETALRIIIELLLPLLLGLIAKFVHEKIQEAKVLKNNAQFVLVQQIVKRFVLAAEQLGLVGMIENIGEEKKKYVMDMVEKELAGRGISIPLETLEAMVEAEVNESFTQVKHDLADLFDLGGEQPAAQ